MSLMEVVKRLEGSSNPARREIVGEYLRDLGIGYFWQNYNSGQNIIVGSGMEFEVGVSSHFDVVNGNSPERVPGANDNASAVVVVLDVLKKVKENPLGNIGVRGLFFDEEEDGLKGSRNYVKFGGAEGLIGLYNMELVGMGDKVALWADGELYEGKMLNTFEKQARDNGVESYRFPYIRSLLSNSGDHQSFNEVEFNEAFCITVISEKDMDVARNYMFRADGKIDFSSMREKMSEAPLFQHYHQMSDKSEYLSEESLQMVSDLVYGSIKEIDEGFNLKQA